MNKTEIIALRITERIKNDIKKITKENNITVSNFILSAIKKELKKYV